MSQRLATDDHVRHLLVGVALRDIGVIMKAKDGITRGDKYQVDCRFLVAVILRGATW